MKAFYKIINDDDMSWYSFITSSKVYNVKVISDQQPFVNRAMCKLEFLKACAKQSPRIFMDEEEIRLTNLCHESSLSMFDHLI